MPQRGAEARRPRYAGQRFLWDKRDRPASSDELLAAQREYYLHTIECFGPERCMFESNFPVDRRSISYRVLWNAFKKLVAGFSETEKHAMFYATAARIYRLSDTYQLTSTTTAL